MMAPTALLRSAAWTICGLSGALAFAGVALAFAEPASLRDVVNSGGVGLAAYEAVVFATFGVLGALVTAREPRNPVGWLLQLIALTLAVNTVGNHVYYTALYGESAVSGPSTYLTWALTWLWILAVVPAFALLPLLFPTGRPLSPRWRRLLPVTIVSAAVLWLGTAFVPGPLDGYPTVDNPVGIDSPAVQVVGNIAFLALAGVALAAITSVVLRFRRSSGVERQQLKGVALSMVFLPFVFAGAGLSDDVGYVLLLGGLFLVVLAVGLAMLRYRLYDVDVVVNRTLVYGGLTAALAAAYLGTVLLLQLALAPLTERSDLAVAGSTLAVAALFRPARSRIQAFVDRRFYRGRYDAARTLSAFTLRLREEIDVPTLVDDLGGVVRDTVAPTHVSLWLRP